MDTLPVELLSIILYLVDDSVVCKFVCKLWASLVPVGVVGDYAGRLACRGHLGLLKWARKNGCLCTCRLYLIAAEYGHINILQWVFGKERLAYHYYAVCFAAARGGRVDVLRWVSVCWSDGHYKMLCNYIFMSRIVRTAAKHGHLNVIIWVMNNGYQNLAQKIDNRKANIESMHDAYIAASQHGHVHVLQWFKDNTCVQGGVLYTSVVHGVYNPYKSITYSAAEFNQLAVLQWAVENGCVYDKALCLTVACDKGYYEITSWIEKHSQI